MPDNEIVASLVKHLFRHGIRLVDYRTFLALSHGEVVQICPETKLPCNSSCVFFNLYSYGLKVKVILSCRPIKVQHNIENNYE